MATLVTATSTAELIDAARAADRVGDPLLLIGGGSNLVAADEGWPGVVLAVRSRGLAWSGDEVTAAAGEPWDEFVAATLADGWAGLEALSGIPGLVGATPVQNVGAYGGEVADAITALTVFDRADATTRRWAPAECRFGLRTSAFKHTDRYLVTDVTFRLRRSPASAPVRYAELAKRLGVGLGASAPAAEVRAAVLELRRGKGMLVDPADHDTWSVGSFFVNPVVPAELAPADCPQWPADDGVKLAAAWLIERAGFARGYLAPSGRVAVSSKHTLALTNRGGGTTAELLELARAIQRGVERQFGVELRPEPRLAPNLEF